jgi:hypothetical protein
MALTVLHCALKVECGVAHVVTPSASGDLLSREIRLTRTGEYLCAKFVEF